MLIAIVGFERGAESDLVGILSEGYSLKASGGIDIEEGTLYQNVFHCVLVDTAACIANLDLRKAVELLVHNEVPVIFSGSSEDVDLISFAYENGGSDFINCPFLKHDVTARVAYQIRRNNQRLELESEIGKRENELLRANTLLNNSVEEYRAILKELQENETLLLTIALNIPNSYLALIEKNFTIGFAAGQELKNRNIDPWSLVGMPVENLFQDSEGILERNLEKTFAGAENSFEVTYNNQYQLFRSVPLRNGNAEISRILVVVENITERKLNEIKISESLVEKETLLKEIHHRVKNNMQLVCSMIDLQVDEMDSPDAYDILRILQSRIYSMSLVHEKLYHNKQLSKIDFKDYIAELVTEISRSYVLKNIFPDIRVELHLQEESFSIDKAIPCGLILNELIINAFKHASIGPNGFIKIIFRKDESLGYILSVIDNGKGLPDDFNIENSSTIGLTLVRELVKQIKGVITVSSGIETSFTVSFGKNMNDSSNELAGSGLRGNRNILLVEDERIISRMIKKIIEEGGYNIIDAVSSGQGAIESAEKHNPDLVIMDIMLEDEIDGVEAAAAIIKKHSCPIIFLTGNSDPATLKSARDINPYTLLTKPVEKIQLLNVIESVFR